MASTDRFMIAPLSSGLQTDIRPWLIPDDAFQELTNAYVFRGRVRKRFGAVNMNSLVSGIEGELSTRLRVSLGNTDDSGNFSNTVPGSIFSVGQMFSVDTQLFTVNVAGTPADMLSTGTATGTFDTTSGAITITGAAVSTPLFYYPSQPVMGFVNYNNHQLENNPLYAFDTQFSYVYTSGGWSRLGTAIWTGDNADFFWAYNWIAEFPYQPTLYVTNYNFGLNLDDSDLMMYWDGSSWNEFNPVINSDDSTDTVVTCRIIVPFKNRLVLLNVVENTGSAPGTNQVYVNRARWSWAGDPTASNAFFDDIDGFGSYADAPTTEAIITAQFLKDRLIVYFESSTWELIYNNNQIQPFAWQQLNTELGAQSTFSEVPFDKVVLGIGNVGVHACNGSNVERIDNKIPEKVFDITYNNSGFTRVAGIRDYFTEVVYWVFPSEVFNQTYPNRLLVYNYKTGSWSFFYDSFTAFGYFENQPTVSWEDNQATWSENNEQWNSSTNTPQFKQIVAGTQQGFTALLRTDVGYNDAQLYITDMVNSGGTAGGVLVTITCYSHNLVIATNSYGEGDYVYLSEVMLQTGDTAPFSSTMNGLTYRVNTVIDENNFTIVVPSSDLDLIEGTIYVGGGILARVSNINIITKQYNFYVQEGRNCAINKVDFLFDRTELGQVTVDYSVSSSSESLLTSGALTGTLVNTGIVETSPYRDGSGNLIYPIENTQSRLWHPIYPFAEGECIQLNIYMSDQQMMNNAIATSDFTLHAMTFYTNPTSSRLQ